MNNSLYISQGGILTIRVWDYLPEFESERDEILSAVKRVFSSGQLIMGPSVVAFEREFADYHGIAHGVGVDNGTNAIVLALRALGIKRGDEVITVSNTAAPTVVAIDSIGAVPVFVDVREDDFLMDVSQLDEVITPRTRCIVPVHLYGQCVNMAAVHEVADRHGIPVLEDCAQAHGARQHGLLAGTMGTLGAFSFYPTKVLGAYGDGGAIITNDDNLHARLKRLHYYGMAEHYYVVSTPGYNSRLDEVQAEILRTKLRRLNEYISDRQKIAAKYSEELKNTGLLLPRVVEGNEHSYYLYVVRHPARDEIITRLKERDIFLNISYRWPVHTMSGFTHLSRYRLPVTERLANELFSLPMYPSLSEQRLLRVIEALHDVVPAP